MPDDRPTDDRMIAYLLGELSEEERARIEERCFADDAVFDQLVAVEAELFDEYARGALPPDRRERFQQKFLATPQQRRRLQFSKTLLGYRPSWRPFWLSWLRMPRPSVLVPVAAVAVLFLVIAGGWLVFHPTQQVVRQPPPQRREPVTVAFTLTPGLTREPEEARPLVLPSGTDFVRFQAELERDEYPAYQASLQTVAGAEVWSQSGLKSQSTVSGRAVVITLPAGLLSNRDYVLALKGQTPAGALHSVADYSFRIDKR